jgi:hypothetical protein
MSYFSRRRLPSISLHLGAHKTGTTFIQHVLVAKDQELTRFGVAMIPLKTVRSRVTSAFGSGNLESGAGLLTETAEKVPSCERVIVSDENISGSGTRDILRQGRPLYFSLASRLDNLCQQVLANRRMTVYFCIRSHVEFLPAMYSEALRHNDFCSFEEYLRGIDLRNLSWIPVVREIASVVGPQNLVLWDFETFKKNPLRIAAAIAGVPEQTLSGASADRRTSASGKAIQALAALRTALADSEIRKLVKSVERALPQGSEYPVFRPFDEQTAQQLRRRHEGDWNEIRRDLSSAVFI